MTHDEAVKIVEENLGMFGRESDFRNALIYLLSLAKKEGETQTVLSAWQSIFGTTQLTHAQARLEQAEKEANKYKDLIKRVDERAIFSYLDKHYELLGRDKMLLKSIVKYLRGEDNKQ